MVQRVAARGNAADEVQVSLDDTLDHLLAEADEEDETSSDQAVVEAHAEARERDAAALRILEGRINEAATSLEAAQQRRNQLALDLEAVELEVRACRDRHWRLSRERRTATHMARVFGTREEIEQQGSNYVSPLTNLFGRAYERYNIAEEVRAEERASDTNTARLQQLLARLYQMPGFRPRDQAIADPEEEREVQNLDNEEVERPPPKTDEEMTIRLACKICLQQTADTAVLPCGHLVMCSYCADVWCPTKENDQTQLLRKAQCPMCRKPIRRRVKVFTS